MQPEHSPFEDGQGLGVDGFSMVSPASSDVPPASVSLSQGDTQRVWQEQQSQNEPHHIEGSGGPELVPAANTTYKSAGSCLGTADELGQSTFAETKLCGTRGSLQNHSTLSTRNLLKQGSTSW